MTAIVPTVPELSETYRFKAGGGKAYVKIVNPIKGYETTEQEWVLYRLCGETLLRFGKNAFHGRTRCITDIMHDSTYTTPWHTDG